MKRFEILALLAFPLLITTTVDAQTVADSWHQWRGAENNRQLDPK